MNDFFKNLFGIKEKQKKSLKVPNYIINDNRNIHVIGDKFPNYSYTELRNKTNEFINKNFDDIKMKKLLKKSLTNKNQRGAFLQHFGVI